MNGFIKLHKKISDSWIYKEKPFDKCHAWIDLLINARYSSTKDNFDGKPMLIEMGQYPTSIEHLCERWGWSRNKVKRFLSVLESDGMITTERTNRRTIITIVNYGIYQGKENKNEPADEPPKGQETNQQTNYQTDYQTNHIKEYKNIENKEELKEEKKTRKKENTKEPKVYFPKNEALNQTFLDYIQMRKEIKKPMSERAIELAVMKLDKMTSDDDTAIKILEQSIMNSWQGLFPLNESRYGSSQHPTNKAQQKLEESREMMRKWAEQED